MNNNDILRRLRYVFDFSDARMLEIFRHAGATVQREQLADWLKREENPGFDPLRDVSLASFLNGLIIDRRGKKDDQIPVAEKRLNNNLILRKLKIALDLQSEDILDLLARADFRMSAHELSAFFRKPDHKHYRECHSQILRNFLTGLQRSFRPGPGNETYE